MEAYISQYSGGIQHAYLHSHLTLHLSSYPGECCIWKGWEVQGSLQVFCNVLEKTYWREVNMVFFLHLFTLNKNILYVIWISWDLFFSLETQKHIWKCLLLRTLYARGMLEKTTRFLMEQITAENAFWTSLYSCNLKISIFAIYGSDLCYPVTECLGMVQRCRRGHADLTQGNLSLPRGCSNAATGFLERWSMPHASQWWRGIWAMPLRTCFLFRSALQWPGSWTWWPLEVPSSINSTWFCSIPFHSIPFHSIPFFFVPPPFSTSTCWGNLLCHFFPALH